MQAAISMLNLSRRIQRGCNFALRAREMQLLDRVIIAISSRGDIFPRRGRWPSSRSHCNRRSCIVATRRRASLNFRIGRTLRPFESRSVRGDRWSLRKRTRY